MKKSRTIAAVADKPTRARTLLVAVASAVAAATVALGWPGSAAAQFITEFPTPTNPSGPYGITLGPDGALWFTEFNGNKIERIKLKAIDVIDVLSDLFILHGVPAHIRSDNGPEFVAKAVQEWIAVAGAKTAYIERGSPWENGYIESFNARLRDELLDGEIFYSLREARIVIESWRRHYNTIRPHASLGYKPPAPEVFVPAFAAWPAALRRAAPPA